MPQQRALDQLGLGAGNQAQHLEDRRHGAERLLVAMAVHAGCGCVRPACSVEREAAGLAPRAPGTPRTAAPARRPPARPAPRPIASISSRSVSRHDGSRPTMAMPASANGSSASISARGLRLGLVDHAGWRGRCGRSTGAAVAALRGRMHACSRRPAARAPRATRILGLEVAVEGVDEQHHRLAPRPQQPRRVAAANIDASPHARRCRGAMRGRQRRAERPSSLSPSARQRRAAVAQVQQPGDAAGAPARSRAGGAISRSLQRVAVPRLVVARGTRSSSAPCRRRSGTRACSPCSSTHRSSASCTASLAKRVAGRAGPTARGAACWRGRASGAARRASTR